MADEARPATGILIEFHAYASNQLPGVLADLADLADLAEESGTTREATAARWDAVAAGNRSMTLRRVAALPAVPGLGEVVYLNPYAEELRAEDVTWLVDPEVGEPHVSIRLSDIDFDVVGDDDALAAFREAGWEIESDRRTDTKSQTRCQRCDHRRSTSASSGTVVSSSALLGFDLGDWRATHDSGGSSASPTAAPSTMVAGSRPHVGQVTDPKNVACNVLWVACACLSTT